MWLRNGEEWCQIANGAYILASGVIVTLIQRQCEALLLKIGGIDATF